MSALRHPRRNDDCTGTKSGKRARSMRFTHTTAAPLEPCLIEFSPLGIKLIHLRHSSCSSGHGRGRSSTHGSGASATTLPSTLCHPTCSSFRWFVIERGKRPVQASASSFALLFVREQSCFMLILRRHLAWGGMIRALVCFVCGHFQASVMLE